MRISDWSSDVCSSDLDDGRATRHGLDHHQAEGFRPVDRNNQRNGAAQELRLLSIADLADILDSGSIEQRPNRFLEIFLIRAVDFRGDLQWNDGTLRKTDRPTDRLLGRNPAKAGEIRVPEIGRDHG